MSKVDLPVKYRHAIITLFKVLLCALVVASFVYCVVINYPETDFHFWGYVMFAALYLIVFLSTANMYHCLNIGTLRKRELLFSFLFSTLLTNLIMYFVVSLLCKYIINPVPLLIMLVFQWICGSIILLLADHIYFQLRPVRDAIMICSADQHETDSSLDKFKHVRESYKVRTIVSESEGIDELKRQISPFSTVIVGQIDPVIRHELVNYCFDNDKRMFIIPFIQDIIVHSSHQSFISDSVMYLCRNRPFTIEQLAIKRFFDILISLLGLIICSPIMLIAALCIKLQDGGPVFFKQERYTRNFKKFTLIKFRSMIVDAEKNGAQFTTENDDRITPVGKILRITRIDELPQFINILRGEMSLVGPRAERIENVDFYCEMLPEFRFRMKVKAGLTGYAQVYGRYNTSHEDKLKLDLLYIENASIAEDLQLLFQTVRVLFVPRDSTAGFVPSSLEELKTSLGHNPDKKDQ